MTYIILIFFLFLDKIVEELCKGNEELEKKLRLVMLEVEVMKQDGRAAPDKIKLDQWERLMHLTSRHQKNKYLTYLWKTEKSKENEKVGRKYYNMLLLFYCYYKFCNTIIRINNNFNP